MPETRKLMKPEYIHGVHKEEQNRLRLLNRLTNEAFLDFVQVSGGERVLEIGSGLGIIANEIAGKHPSSSVVGMEYSPDQIAQCDKSHENLEFIRGDAHGLPFGADTFDVVYGRYILEHLSNPPGALKEVHRVLKTGGRVYFQENTISVLKLYPECPAFSRIWTQFIKLQTALGGDAEIGVKLYSLFRSTGFTQLEPSWAGEIHYPGKDSFGPWIENIIGNITGASGKLIKLKLAKGSQIRQAIDELHAFMEKEDACTYFYWNRIKGRKGTGA